MEKEHRFRILNKTSKTVTVKLQGKPMTFSWDEFNKKLIVVDKVWAVLNEEEKKKQEEAEDMINQIVVSVLVLKGNSDHSDKLIHLGMIGGLLSKAAELLECSNVEVIQIVRERLMMINPFMVNPMFPMDKKQKSIRHRNETSIRKEGENKPTPVFEEKKPTFGDAFACLGELKEKMDKEG